MKAFHIAVLCVIVLATPAAFAAGPDMNPGQWEITSRLDMQGLPFAMPPITYSQCLTREDVVPRKAEKNKECTPVKTDLKGNTVSWVVECRDAGTVTRSTGTITYRKDAFDGVVTVENVPLKPGETPVKMTMSGKRLGACK